MEEKKIVEEESFAKALLKEYAKTAKRWFIIAMVILFAWLATIECICKKHQCTAD